jgi:hypothetical protein
LKAHHSWRNGWKDADTELLELVQGNWDREEHAGA